MDYYIPCSYHEKTGVWVSPWDEKGQQISKQYGREFYEKYWDTLPESLKPLVWESLKKEALIK
jgi:hypothetical protein